MSRSSLLPREGVRISYFERPFHSSSLGLSVPSGDKHKEHQYRSVPAGVETYTILFRILQRITRGKWNTFVELRT